MRRIRSLIRRLVGIAEQIVPPHYCTGMHYYCTVVPRCHTTPADFKVLALYGVQAWFEGCLHHERDRYLAGPCTRLHKARHVVRQAESLKLKSCGVIGPQQGSKAVGYGMLKCAAFTRKDRDQECQCNRLYSSTHIDRPLPFPLQT